MALFFSGEGKASHASVRMGSVEDLRLKKL